MDRPLDAFKVRLVMEDIPSMDLDVEPDEPLDPDEDPPDDDDYLIDPYELHNGTSPKAAEIQTSPDLKLISWPPGLPLPPQWKKYPFEYDENNATETWIYVLDSGINDRHPVRI